MGYEETADSAALGVFVQGRAANVNLNHNPDKPLAVDIPFLQVDEKQIFSSMVAATPSDPLLKHTNQWTKPDPDGGHAKSKTMINVELSIASSGETLTMPCETGATIDELVKVIGYKAGVQDQNITFVSKQGCSWRTMLSSDQVRPKMKVNGIKSFKRARMEYRFPKVIIGAGHLGLKTAMILLKRRDTDFMVLDRMSRVGGTSWMYQANTTSKLQTEYGSYHLEWDSDNPCPTMFNSPWPSRNRLLEHFQRVCEDFGVIPYCKFCTNVKHMDMYDHDGNRTKKFVAQKWWEVERYLLTTEKVDIAQLHHGRFVRGQEEASEDEQMIDCSAIMFFPGNLTLPREETYRNEDAFEGQIGYGMFDEVDYSVVPGKNAAIVGHGAFAVENVRTCCEYGAHKCYLICRRKNIACPRVCSWMANRSYVALPCAEFLNVMRPMYDLIGWDVWTYYSVNTNEKRTNVQITQKARFGIGDIYFLSIYMGKMEVVVDPKGIKRLSADTVHMESGRKLENIKVILKLLGFVGELDNDRLMQIKEMVGFWVNDDPRRYLVAEPVSVMATNMGGTSFSPGAMSWAVQGIWFIHYPNDYAFGVSATGMLPRHSADMSDEGTPRPAYVVDARHGTVTGITVTTHTPLLGQEQQFDGYIKAVKHRLCHPMKKFLAACKEDWDYYAKRFLDEGFGVDKPYPDYPYTPALARKMLAEHNKLTGEPELPTDYEDLQP